MTYFKEDGMMVQEAMLEQITRACRYWMAEAPEKLQPSLHAYRTGLKRCSRLAHQQGLRSLGIGDPPKKLEVPKTSLIAFPHPKPGSLLTDTPDDAAVDAIVQIGLFNGIVFR